MTNYLKFVRIGAIKRKGVFYYGRRKQKVDGRLCLRESKA